MARSPQTPASETHASKSGASQPGHGAHPGYSARKDSILLRVRKIEGQIRGIERMIGEDAYCIDVLTQVAAATKALKSVSLLLLTDHLNHCVVDAVNAAADSESGSQDELAAKLDEAVAAIERLVKS